MAPSSNGGDGTAPDAGGDSGTVSGMAACGIGTLLAGDPLYNDKTEVPGPKPAGQGLLDDPPIRNEAVAVIGSRVFIETEFEIWSADLSEKSPKLARFAGTEGAKFVSAGVACKDTTFLVIRDMAATADGKLVVVDYVGGAVIEITDPAGPNCKSEWVAGTHEKTADPGNDYPLAKGDQRWTRRAGAIRQHRDGSWRRHSQSHGRRRQAKPIYTWDEGTGKFKEVIATDKDRTVSTIGVGATDDNVMGLSLAERQTGTQPASI